MNQKQGQLWRGVVSAAVLAAGLVGCGGTESATDEQPRSEESLGTQKQAASWYFACQPFSPPPVRPEQYTACQGKQQGDTCWVGPGYGTCYWPPQMTCVLVPPPPAMEACYYRNANDPCSFSMDGNWVNGACTWQYI